MVLNERSVVAHESKQLRNTYVDMTAEMIRGTAMGLGYYDHVSDVQLCDDALQLYGTMWVKSVSRYLYGDSQNDWLEGTWYLTDSMGQLSFVLRRCYGAYDGVKDLYVKFFKSIIDFPDFSTIIHLNIANGFYALNDYGKDAYLGYYRKDWTVFARGIARMLYLTIFAESFESNDDDTTRLRAPRSSDSKYKKNV